MRTVPSRLCRHHSPFVFSDHTKMEATCSIPFASSSFSFLLPPTTRRRMRTVPFWSRRLHSTLILHRHHTKTDEDCSVLFVSPAFYSHFPLTTRRRMKPVPLCSCRWRSLFFSTDHTKTNEDSSALFVSPAFSFFLYRSHDDERGPLPF